MTTSTPSPQEQVKSDFNSLKYDVERIQRDAQLTDLRETLAGLDTKINGLPQGVLDLRARGYAFETQLENRAADLVKRWTPIRIQANSQITTQSSQLRTTLPAIEQKLSGISRVLAVPAAARSQISALKTDVDSLESRISAAERAVRSTFDSFKDEAEKFISHFTEINESLDLLEQACFELLPSEGLVMAVKAVWARDGKEDKEDPDGYLYLTDQRMIFEQKEEVATKKVLFITTESKLVQQMLFEVPVALIQDVKATQQGLLKNEDNLEFTFASGAFSSQARLHIWQSSEKWAGLIKQVKNGEMTRDRAIAVDQAAVEKAKAAPTQCPYCGGALTQPVLRGQENISCPFCGGVIRL